MKLCRIITAIAAHLLLALSAAAQINVDQVIRVGRNALYFEDYVLSIQYFNQAIDAKPYLAQPYFYRAIAKYSLDDMRGAAADATLAIDRNPYITDAYEIRGVVRQNMGDLEGAISDYNKVLEMMPVNKGVLYNLAIAHQEAGRIDSAEVVFNRLFKIAPGFDRGYTGYAAMLLEKGDTVGAQAKIDKALEINRFNVGALLFHANLAMKEGKEGFKTALADMDEAIRLEPRQSSFFVNRAYLRHELDDYYGAMSDFDYALQLDPANTSAFFNRALLRAEVGDNDRAVADLDKVVALTGGRDYRALFNRAMINKERGRLTEALADAESIVEAFPDMPAAYFLRYDVREAMDDRGAKSDLDHSIALARAARRDSTVTDPKDIAEGKKTEERPHDPFFDFDPENSDAVAGRFNSLVTVDTQGDAVSTIAALGGSSSASRQRSIRGRVQDVDDALELEPMFVVTYYSAPTELKPSGDYMKEAEEVNNTHVLRYLLQVTNNESMLDDPDDIRRHFEGVEYYNSYISTHNPRAIDYFGRGMDFMTVRDYSHAIKDFTEAANLAPDFTLAYFVRSIARLREAESEAATDADNGSTAMMTTARRNAAVREAMADLDTVIALSPRLAIAHFNKGVIYALQGDYTSALTSFSKAIELKPDMGEAWYNRGFMYFRLGNGTAGASDLSHAGQLGIVPSYSLLKRMRQ